MITQNFDFLNTPKKSKKEYFNKEKLKSKIENDVIKRISLFFMFNKITFTLLIRAIDSD